MTRLTQGDHGKILVDRSGEGRAYVSICTIVGSVYFACNVYSAISYKFKKKTVYSLLSLERRLRYVFTCVCLLTGLLKSYGSNIYDFCGMVEHNRRTNRLNYQ